MFPWESRRARRNGRGRRRPDLAALERLEGRELLAFSPLGFSLPDLTVTGFASPAAAWGGPVTVTVNVQNTGASTLIEPLALAPGSTSSADAAASSVGVFAVRNPRSLAGAVPVGFISVPALAQNNAEQVTQTLTMPPKPGGFPGDGGKVYLVFLANATGSVFESDAANNVSPPVPLLIEAPLPELAAVGLDVPPVMQPGDTIQPNIRVANFGPADTDTQGPVVVALVASTTPNFTSGSTIVASYSVPNIPGVSQTSSKTAVFGDANLNPPQNIVTIAGAPVTLPTSPAVYYLGVVVDPLNQIKQLQKVPQFTRPRNPFTLSHKVGPPIPGLPPAGVLVPGGVANVPVFPFPFGGNPIGGAPGGTSTTPVFPFQGQPITASSTTTTTTTGGGGGVILAASAGRHNARLAVLGHSAAPKAGVATTFHGLNPTAVAQAPRPKTTG